MPSADHLREAIRASTLTGERVLVPVEPDNPDRLTVTTDAPDSLRAAQAEVERLRKVVARATDTLDRVVRGREDLAVIAYAAFGGPAPTAAQVSDARGTLGDLGYDVLASAPYLAPTEATRAAEAPEQ